MTMMQNKRLGVSYYKAWMGKQLALNHLRGDPEESYRIMAAYLFVVKQVNKDTVTHLEIDSSGRFKYMFLAYGVCIHRFRRMQKVIAIDGTFLKAKYRGVLRLAIAQDRDLHQYPIAWAVVDSENEMSWTWFLEKLHELIPDDRDLVIISDRHVAIIAAVAAVYKHSHHLHCTWHLSQNIATHCGKKGGGAELFMKTAYACKISEFNMLYEKLKNQYPSVTAYLDKSTSPDKWSRAFCRGNRYDIMTTNGAESINYRLSEERELPIIAMLNALQSMVSVWFNKHRTSAELASSRTKLIPLIELILRTRFNESQFLKVTQLNYSKYHVVGDDTDEVVDFSTYLCSCCVFQCDKILCKHALAACHLANYDIYELCSPYYLMHMWRQAYSGTIYSVPHQRDWKIHEDISILEVLPPHFKPKRGRPNKQRRPSTGEFGRQRKNKCSICNDVGNYKSTCTRNTT
ncbi:protein FAR1-RELATED SEQUENCE 4-like [Henckelia pumila]|uniref:protein FAR1-RELATED SEQUENCE 4-like n=1 Tax=Henckelia pumila TaxID=405737 RepID=UPI003C6E2C07